MAKTVTPPLPFTFQEKEGDPYFVKLYTDGASRGNPGLAGIGVVIQLGNGTTYEAKKFIGTATNNVAEYEALIFGLKQVKARKLFHPLVIYSDSQLLVRQLKGQYRIKKPHLKALAEKVHELLRSFPLHEIIHIPRGENSRADKLANEAIDERNRKV